METLINYNENYNETEKIIILLNENKDYFTN